MLSDEPELYDSIRDAIDERSPVWRARTAEEAVDLLITGRCGVLLIDLASVAAQPDVLVHRILDQFPDVVVCAAGLREDEPRLAHLVSEGHIYRYMHKPLSARRAGMFLQAAMRHHHAKRAGPVPVLAVPDNVVSLPSRLEPLRWVVAAFGIALFVMLLSVFVDDRPPTSLELADAPAADAAPAPEPAPPAAAAQPSPPANPVLARAREALDAGRFEAPPGRNALDLYRAVVLAQPGNADARAGLEATLVHVLADADAALAQGRIAEARRLVDRVLEVDPQRSAAVQLSARVEEKMPPPPPAPVATPAPVRVAAPAAAADGKLVRASTTASASATSAAASGSSATSAAKLAARPAVVAPPPGVKLPDPVTRLPRPGDAVAETRATAPPPPIVVRPDPLAARIVNAAPKTPPRPRIYARAVEPLPIAGYEKTPHPEPETTAAHDAAAGTGPAASSGVVLPAESFERLEVTDPIYPLEALRTRTEGWVELEFTITPNGAVRDIEVVGAEPRGVFDRSAADALARWRFKPRLVNGQPATQRSTLIMRFNLDS